MFNVECFSTPPQPPHSTFNIQHLTFNGVLRDPPARVAEREVASAIGPQGHAHSPAPRGWVRGGRVAEGSRATHRILCKEQKRGVTPLCGRFRLESLLETNLNHQRAYCSDLSHKIQLLFLYQSAFI